MTLPSIVGDASLTPLPYIPAMPMNPNEVSAQIVDAAIKVHKILGLGLLESAYSKCLAFELRQRGLQVLEEVPMPVIYEGHRIDLAYRIDMLVEDIVIVENKAVSTIHPIHEAQILSHLRIGEKRVGLLLNFHALRMKEGIKRFVNG